MRLHVGDVGPLPAVQSFECTGNIDITRDNEYDSDEQILTLGIATFAGNFEVKDCERLDVYKGLTGKAIANISDVVIDNFGAAPLMLNVWNRQKTRFIKSYLVVAPTYSSDPFPTTVNGTVSMRFEYQAVKGVRFPQHASGFITYAANGVGPYNLGSAVAPPVGPVPTPVKLSRKFGGQYVTCVFQKIPDAQYAGDFDYEYLCVASSTTTSFTLKDPATSGATVVAYYCYVSTAEAGGYVCSTL